MIIDCHTHCYPEELSENPRAWAEARGELHWADLVAPLDRKSIQDWAGPEKFLSAMNAAGVDKVVLLGWYWENESTCRWHNEVIAEWVRLRPERFIGFASILPDAKVIDQLEAAKALGLSGVGELHPGVQGFDASNPHFQKMARWCAEHRWPVNFHATTEDGKDHPAAVPTPLEDYLKMAADYPELSIILAHWGGGLPLREDMPLPKKLYFDSAASPLLYRKNPLRQIIDRVGIRQVLFGSDYPLRVYPRQQKVAGMQTFLESMRVEAGLSDAEKAAFLGANMGRILAETRSR